MTADRAIVGSVRARRRAAARSLMSTWTSTPGASAPSMRRLVLTRGARMLSLLALSLGLASAAQARSPGDRSADPSIAGSSQTAAAPQATRWAPDIRETVIRVPVSLRHTDGHELRADLPVTMFRPAGPGPFPLVVINHGRDQRQRTQYDRQRFESAARFFIRKGFAVAVPLRLGYGELASVGDPESSVSCDRPRFGVAVDVAALQINAVVRQLAQSPDLDVSRVLLVGQSVGGLAALAAVPRLQAAGLSPMAAINFAGGHGANPQASPGLPCQPDQLAQELRRWAAAQAGRSAEAMAAPPVATTASTHTDGRATSSESAAVDGVAPTSSVPAVPTLWLYAENDRSFAPSQARAWAQAYQQAGGAVTLMLLPPSGDDGHRLFTDANDRWQPLVDDFLRRWGVELPGALPFPSGGRIAVDDERALPSSSPELRQLYRQFLAARTPRAFAMNGQSRSAFATGDDAQSRALAACEQGAQAEESCRLYAVNHTVVWSFP